MSGVTGAVVAGSVVAAGVSAYGARQASKAAGGAAGQATAENARQFDIIRADTAAQRALGQGATGLLGRLYGINTAPNATLAGSQLIGDSGGIPAVNAELYANDPAYRYAWDKTLETEKATRPGWSGQDTYFMRANDADWARLNESMARNLAEYRAQNPQDSTAVGSGRPDMSAFVESPDYQFNLQEGQKALDRSLLARGRGLSGAGVKEGVRYASGMASNEFGNYFNRLSTLAGMGSAATNTSAQAGLTTAANNANIITNAANTRASAYMQGAAGVNNAVQGGLSNFMLLNYLNKQPVS